MCVVCALCVSVLWHSRTGALSHLADTALPTPARSHTGSHLPTAVPCCAVLCCAVLRCAALCCAVLCCAVLCCAVLCCAVLCCAVLCCADDDVLCFVVSLPCDPLLCCAVQPYVALGKIEESHKEYLKLALLHFDRIATMGSKDRIAEFRDKLELKITEMKEDYIANNANKRPDILRFITILLMISSLVYLSSSMLNIFCWPPQTLGFDFEYADMCGGALSVMRDVYLTIFVFIVLTLLTSCWGSIGPLLQVALAGQQATPEKKNQ